MRDHQAVYPIATMGRVLRVSPSGFYAWRQRPASARAQRDAEVLIAIRAWPIRSDGTYGAPRLLGDLREAGLHVGQKRIARLMRARPHRWPHVRSAPANGRADLRGSA